MKQTVVYLTVLALAYAVSAQGASERRPFALDIAFSEGVVPARLAARSALGAGVVYTDSKRRNLSDEVGEQADRAEDRAVGHDSGLS